MNTKQLKKIYKEKCTRKSEKSFKQIVRELNEDFHCNFLQYGPFEGKAIHIRKTGKIGG